MDDVVAGRAIQKVVAVGAEDRRRGTEGVDIISDHTAWREVHGIVDLAGRLASVLRDALPGTVADAVIDHKVAGIRTGSADRQESAASIRLCVNVVDRFLARTAKHDLVPGRAAIGGHREAVEIELPGRRRSAGRETPSPRAAVHEEGSPIAARNVRDRQGNEAGGLVGHRIAYALCPCRPLRLAVARCHVVAGSGEAMSGSDGESLLARHIDSRRAVARYAYERRRRRPRPLMTATWTSGFWDRSANPL